MKTWQLADGRRLGYRDAGSGRPLVLLHGWAMSSAVFAEIFRALSGEYRLLAPDLRGHGGSDPGPGYGLDDFAGDLSLWLEGLDLGSCDLLGWSLGGQVALRLASLEPDRIERLLLVSSTPRFVTEEDWTAGLPPGQVKLMGRNLRRRFRETLDRFFSSQFAANETTPQRMEEIRSFAGPGARAAWPAAEAAASSLETLAAADLRLLPAGLPIPALVVHGEKDAIIPATAGKFLADSLPRGCYVGLEDAGHAPFLTRPDRFLGLIREFCQP